MNMQLYVTYGSPYARLARIIVIEKALEDRVEIIEANTRTSGSPYHQINPSGRVPYLVDDTGVGMEDSQLICAFLDGLDCTPRSSTVRRTHPIGRTFGWSSRREACARVSPCGVGKMARLENERSPTTLAHESARAQRMADFFEGRVTDPLMQGGMAHLILAVAVEMARKRGLGDLTASRPRLASWMRSISGLPSMKRTVPPATLNKIGLGKARSRCLALSGPLDGSFHVCSPLSLTNPLMNLVQIAESGHSGADAEQRNNP
jgi:glutathione S-transferase